MPVQWQTPIHIYIYIGINVTPGSPLAVHTRYTSRVCLGFIIIITILYSPPRLSHLLYLHAARLRFYMAFVVHLHNITLQQCSGCVQLSSMSYYLPWTAAYLYLFYMFTDTKDVLYSRRRHRRYPTPRGEPIFYSRGRQCSGENRDGDEKTRSLSPKFHLPRSRAPFFRG